MGSKAESLIAQNSGSEPPSPHIFSRLSKKGRRAEFIEPLAGVLRDPRFPCRGTGANLVFSIEWLVMADRSILPPGGKKLFFDAGGTRFADAMRFFASHYESRGILFDHIYVWEANRVRDYWQGVMPDIRAQWEPRVTFYNGVPVSPVQGHEHNVVNRIHSMCTSIDFCAFKLDIDTPTVEMALVHQLLGRPEQTA